MASHVLKTKEELNPLSSTVFTENRRHYKSKRLRLSLARDVWSGSMNMQDVMMLLDQREWRNSVRTLEWNQRMW